MDKMLKYFGGSKGKFALFIVPMVLYILLSVVINFLPNKMLPDFYSGSALELAAVALLVAAEILIWFDVSRFMSVVCSILSFIIEIWLAVELCLEWTTRSDFYPFSYLMKRAMWCNASAAAFIMALVLIVIRRKKNFPAFKALFVMSIALTFVGGVYYLCSFRDMSFLIIMAKTALYDVSLVGLAVPLICYKICPECGYRNEQGTAFCGGCGNKLN